MSDKTNSSTNKETFAKMVEAAKAGDATQLNQFFIRLYQKGKQSLLGLTKSEVDAEEYFAVAVTKFWEKFIVGNSPLPKINNIEGYIYQMAKFLCLDDKRSTTKLQIVSGEAVGIENRKEFSQTLKTEQDFLEVANLETMQQTAMLNAITKLGERCQTLFNKILETGIEKSRDLYQLLGLENARSVTVLRYECTQQLKKKAAIELALLLKQKK